MLRHGARQLRLWRLDQSFGAGDGSGALRRQRLEEHFRELFVDDFLMLVFLFACWSSMQLHAHLFVFD